MKRIMRRMAVLVATLVAAFVAASPSLAGMNDGGGFYAATAPAPQLTCAQAVSAVLAALVHGQPVDLTAVVTACRR